MGQKLKHYTLGFISTYQVYEGTTIDPHAYAILQGIRAAATEKGCNLLLACGVGPRAGAQVGRPAWPMALPGSDFAPVGPWNVDGLIVAPQRLTQEQTQYIQDLMADRFPVVFTTTDMPGPAVAQDNHNGVKDSILHLLQHGHRRIAFIAGHRFQTGDYAERLQAYITTLKEVGLAYDPLLVANGECSYIGGYEAMKKIVADGALFSAVVTNNDRSGFGAVKALREAGWRVPEDIAVVGFDNILESQAHSPPLTTVHNSTFTLGHRLVDYLIQRIVSEDPNLPVIRIPTRLVIRQSCNCQPGKKLTNRSSPPSFTPEGVELLVHDMLDAVLSGTQHITQDEVESWCRWLAEAYHLGLEQQGFASFDETLSSLLLRMHELDEDPLFWQNAIAELQQYSGVPLGELPHPLTLQRAEVALDRAWLEINEESRRHTARKLFWHQDRSDRLSLMTAELLAVSAESEIQTILSDHLEPFHLRQLTLLLFEPDGMDPVGRCRVLLHVSQEQKRMERQFPTRQFPPPNFYAEPYQLVLLPIIVNEQVKGCVVFDAPDLEPCGSIVHNLASALRNIALYREAVEGRRLAEEANQLKSRFLSMVSHELRTPLNMIVGLSEILLREKSHANLPTPNYWQDLERIYRNAQQLGWLIGDVLDLASSEAGQLRLIHEPIDLLDVMQVVITSGEQLAREKGLAWEARLPASCPWVVGDRTRLRQVALNFITNAIKFTEQGKVSLEITCQGSQIVVAVSDTGLGVPEEEQSELFNEFHRSGTSIRRGYGGIGLGLAISKQLVELHQGTIGMYSLGKEGSGSTFFFTLPSIQPQEPAADLEQNATLEQYSVAFLTAQDAAHNPFTDQLIANGIGVRVYPVDQDPVWLPKLLVSKSSAILLDEQLASHLGWEILHVLKRHASTEQIPVMVHSYNLTKDQGAILELNYLQKPLSPDHLAEMLSLQAITSQDNSQKRSILVVDDDPDTLEFNARLILSQIGNCQVYRARNGLEAVAVLRETPLDLVLLDLMMPDLDGFGVLETMQENERTRAIPVIVVTAKTLTESDLERFNRGVVAVLSKGMFSARETIDRILGVLAKIKAPGSTTHKMVRKAVAYIHAHYQEPITRDQIAKFIGINADYLTVCFNQELGIPTMTYLNRYRVNRAQTMLEQQDKKITEIAAEVGFSDSAYFSRIFLRETGVSPRAYQHGKRASG